MASERRRETNREWQRRSYWSDPAYRERRLEAARDWKWRNPDKVYMAQTRRSNELAIRRFAALLGIDVNEILAS